jgi:hypothetical protein
MGKIIEMFKYYCPHKEHCLLYRNQACRGEKKDYEKSCKEESDRKMTYQKYLIEYTCKAIQQNIAKNDTL